VFQLSPSRIARYFYHECDRYLRYFATPRAERKAAGIPQPPYDASPVTAAILEGGYAWETEVIRTHLKGRVRIARGKPDTELRERTFDARQTVKELQLMEPGEYLYQGTLLAPPEFYQVFGLDPGVVSFAACRPDLILRVPDEGGEPIYRVIDVKASDALKTSHKVQTALYSLLLGFALSEAGIPGRVDLEQAGIWLYGRGEPEWYDMGAVRAHVESFLSRELPRILGADLDEVPWHLHYRCEWCEYFEHCRAEAEQAESVSLVPYMTPGGRRHLWSLGVHTLDQFAELLERPDAPALLAPCASLAGKEERLRQAVAALRQGEARTFGGASLAMPQGEHVRLLLTLQREPVSGRIYAAALLRTGNDAVFAAGRRHEEQFIAATPNECVQVRQDFVRQLHEILTELDEFNAGRPWDEQKSLQAYVFDSYEADLLRELLLDALRDAEVAEEALALLFFFHSEELVEADEHPGAETDFPIVVLTDVIRSLMSLPIPVAYRLGDVVAALPPAGRQPFAYRENDYFTFRLSNALRSDAIFAAWQRGKAENVQRIAKELRVRLWAAWNVVDGIRSAAVTDDGRSLLFAWPPRFRLPEPAPFRDPILSRLAFITRYESLLGYLAVRAGRALPRSERERAGLSFTLRALGGDRFMAEPAELAAELEPGFGRWLLTEDSPEGERTHLAFSDYRYRNKPWVPRRSELCYAFIEEVDASSSPGRVTLTLDLTRGSASPEIVKGRRYLLTQSYLDWNSDRVVDRLLEIDRQGGASGTDGRAGAPTADGRRTGASLAAARTGVSPVAGRRTGGSLLARLLGADATESSRASSSGSARTRAVPAVVQLLADPVGSCCRMRLESGVRTAASDLLGRADLTPSQRDAFRHVLNHSLTLLWGPPGTGKTHFLAMEILILLESHRRAGRPLRVLVTGFTHAAIENCLFKLADLRARTGIAAEVAKLGEIQREGGGDLGEVEPEAGPAFLHAHPQCVLGGTTYGLLKMFRGAPDDAPFDLVVVDEGSQLRVPEALLAISRLGPGGRLVVAGDDLQLPPIVQGAYPDPAPGEPLLNRSLFEALREPDRGRDEITCQLYENFRMNASLSRFPAFSLYGERYQSASEEIGGRRLTLAPTRRPVRVPNWVDRAIDPEYPLVLCVLEGVQAGAENQVEADLVAEMVRVLRLRQCQPDSARPYPVGPEGDRAFWRQGLFIVSPHHAQIRAIRRALEGKGLNPPFFVDTVDKMQGQECDTVLVSYGVADPEYAMQEGEFIYSLNRLNVAITRARRKCVVFLPRPLLTPSLEVLEQPDAAAGIGFMLGLERYVSEQGESERFPVPGGELLVSRVR